MSDIYADLPLGKDTEYSTVYDPGLLCPIERKLGRAELGIEQGALPFKGHDSWTAYEVSWLNARGKPVVAIADFRFDCTSRAIIESKSFKLYLNSFNQSRFDSMAQVKASMKKDLSEAAGGDVQVTLYAHDEWDALTLQNLPGECLDGMDIAIDCYETDADLLMLDQACAPQGHYYSHLLRSLCPVTGQPDWGSLVVRYQGAKVDPQGLLKYIVSFREHQDFHEQCVERIYCDIMRRCQPESLTVYARYVRRGGLDINPYRSSGEIDDAFERSQRQ